MFHNPPARAPIITIEGPDQSINTILMEQLSYHIKTPSNRSPRYNEDFSTIGLLVSQSRRGLIELSDLVHYNLRNANLWEHQADLRELSKAGVTVIFNNYVLSNRATLLMKGNMSIELCPQLDTGLLKPDLQFLVECNHSRLNNLPSLFSWDTIQTRINLSEAYNQMATSYPDLHVIDYTTEDILDAAEKLINLYDQLKLDQLPGIQVFSGEE